MWENWREKVDNKSIRATKKFIVFFMTFVKVVIRLKILLNITEHFFNSIKNADMMGHLRELKSIKKKVKEFEEYLLPNNTYGIVINKREANDQQYRCLELKGV